MSSKLLPEGDARAIETPVWRQIGGAARAALRSEGPPPERDTTGEALRQWELRVAEARAAALREGEAAGRDRAMAEMQAVLERLAASIDEIASLRGRLRREAEADTVQLAVAIARRVLRRELAVDPEALHGLVLAALEKLQAQEICRVRVHPQQVPSIAALLRRKVTAV